MPTTVDFPTIVNQVLELFGDVFDNQPARRHFAEYLKGKKGEQTPILPGKAVFRTEALTASRGFWRCTGGALEEGCRGRQATPAPCKRRRAPWRSGRAPGATCRPRTELEYPMLKSRPFRGDKPFSCHP